MAITRMPAIASRSPMTGKRQMSTL